jgi:hypothetical protein
LGGSESLEMIVDRTEKTLGSLAPKVDSEPLIGILNQKSFG